MNYLAVLSNPRRRRGRKARRRKARAHTRRRRRASRAPVVIQARRRNPSRRHRRHAFKRRRNPSSRRMFGGLGSGVSGLVMPGFLGAAGALGFDFAWGKLSGYLPASLQGSYYVSAGIKLLAAVGIAKFGGKVMSRQTANAVAAGVAVVTLYDVGQILIGSVTAPAASTATPVHGLGERVGMGSLGYTGTGMSISTSGMPSNRFTGFGERVGFGTYGDDYGNGQG